VKPAGSGTGVCDIEHGVTPLNSPDGSVRGPVLPTVRGAFVADSVTPYEVRCCLPLEGRLRLTG
jgi:hypothetical protein